MARTPSPGCSLILPEVSGVAGDVTTGGFTVTAMDGTKTGVRVSDATTWLPVLPGSTAPGASSLKDGDMVVARGKLAADGSMDASTVTVPLTITTDSGGPGLMVPPVQCRRQCRPPCRRPRPRADHAAGAVWTRVATRGHLGAR